MITVTCRCRQSMQVSEESAGQLVECLSCGAAILVPGKELPAPASPFPPAAPPAPVGAFHLPVSASCGALLVIGFFMPWLRLSCDTTMLSEPTGYNLATNTEDATMKTFQKNKNMGEGKAEVTAGSSEKGTPPWGKSTPELWLFPLLGVALAGWGLLRLKSPSENPGGEAKIALFAVIGAVILLSGERMASYRKEMLADLKKEIAKEPAAPAAQPDPEKMGADVLAAQMKNAFQIKDAVGFWLTLAALLAAGGGLAAWMLREAGRSP